MKDEETNSQWSHLMGRAMDGPLKGSELNVIPSEMTDWKTWKAKYPGTDVLDMGRTTRAFVTEVQKEPNTFTLGLRMGDEAADFPFDELRQSGVVSEMLGGTPLLVTYDEESATARAFSRRVNGETLEFRLNDKALQDVKTSSTWNPASGQCTKGKMKGTNLEMLPGIPSFVKAWRVFYPKSKTFKTSR